MFEGENQMKKNMILTVAIIVIGCMNLYPVADEIRQECRNLVGMYWDIVDYKYSEQVDQEKLFEMMHEFNAKLKDITVRTASSTAAEDNAGLKSFSEFYLECPPELRPVFDRVVNGIIESSRNFEPLKDTGRMVKEYFPGYGYSDPDYTYRRGKEISSEFLYARWLDEERTYSEEKEFELTVELKLVAELKLKFPDLEVIKEFGVEIGGHLIMCAKVKIKTNKTLTVKTKKKIGQYKKWFELLKAKKTFWSAPVWENCGQTYVHFEEPTGEEVVTAVKDVN